MGRWPRTAVHTHVSTRTNARTHAPDAVPVAAHSVNVGIVLRVVDARVDSELAEARAQGQGGAAAEFVAVGVVLNVFGATVDI